MLDRITQSLCESKVRQRIPNPGLNAKIILIVVLISLIGVVASSVFVLTLQREQLVDSALTATTLQSDAINATLVHAMYDHDQAMMTLILQRMVEGQSIDQIRILDAKGIVRASSSPAELGAQLDYSMPTCQFCHTNGKRPSNRSAIIEVEKNHEALVNVSLIYNEAQCQACHDPQTTILGITMIQEPLVNLNHQLTQGFWRIVVSGLVTLGLLVLLMTLALRRLVIKPVEQLRRGMTEIRGGNLEYRLPQAYANDELGELAKTFDTLRAQLKATRDENAELQKRTHSLAILEERERLAREIHDNLAQTLGYINLKAAVADGELASNQIAQARASLLELKRAAKEAYVDARESIFNLRRAPASDDGLLASLTNSLAEYQIQTGIRANLFVEDERLTEFPVEVQVQLNRIIQEALTNARKHSRATEACVRFERVNSHIEICIQDNGTGFDLEELSHNGSGHFGLQIMRERAASVGGEIAIDSQRGIGTRVKISVPVYPAIEEPHDDASYSARG